MKSKSDSPYERRKTADGGIAILANGRSAVALLVRLEDMVRPARKRLG